VTGISRIDQPDVDVAVDVAIDTRLDRPWAVVVWDDPVNLMSYVVYVFQRHFGYSHEEATKLMFEVHNAGKSAVAHGNREEVERHAEAMHAYGLWATIEKTGEG